MRVRTFGLRLLAGVLTALWAIAGGIVLIGYRPGGPADAFVGLAALLPLAVSLLGLLWPPVVRGDRAFAGVAWLGLGAILLLVPSIGSVLAQLLARGAQTLLPSWEAVYPWVLALLATSLFGGLGVARRVLGSTAMRRRRLELGVAVAVVATTVSGSAFAAAAIANEVALRDVPSVTSRFGPTSGASEPPHCTDAIAIGPSATVSLEVHGDVDGRPIGSIGLRGVRNGVDVAWTADVTTEVMLGQFGLVRVDGSTWTRPPRASWEAVGHIPAPPPPPDGPPTPPADPLVPTGRDFPAVVRPALDREVLASALSPGYRAAAEERGLEYVEGARARHCRVALDGRTFQWAFPEVGWMSVRQDLHRWRGTLDFWVFLDGDVGQVTATVNGEAQSLGRSGLQANLMATLTATDRDKPVAIQPPTP
jgi:hypothetical protein